MDKKVYKGLELARKAPKKPRLSMRAAINAKCKECIHDPLSGLGSWRQQVEGCTSVDCPLYELRPRSKAGGGIVSKKNRGD